MIRIVNLTILLFSILTAGCSPNHPPVVSKAPSQPSVLVINSNSAVPRYGIAENAFLSSTRASTQAMQITRLDLKDDNQPIETLLDTVNTAHYDAIYAIGAKALGSIDYIAPSTPIVFSSVLSWRRFADKTDYHGVASEVLPEAQLTWFKHFFPEIRTIAILYSGSNQAMINDALTAASKLSIQLRPIEVNRSKDTLIKLSSHMENADALWIMPDPIVLESEQAIWKLFETAHQNELPVFAYSRSYMDLGATMTINADLATNGRQASLLVQKLLEDQTPPSGIQFPAGSSISLNLKKAYENNLKLNMEALNSVDELFSE